MDADNTEDGCLGMGALYGVSARIVGALISFCRKFLTACNANAAGDCEGIQDAKKERNWKQIRYSKISESVRGCLFSI
jgi:hypothetical protein